MRFVKENQFKTKLVDSKTFTHSNHVSYEIISISLFLIKILQFKSHWISIFHMRFVKKNQFKTKVVEVVNISKSIISLLYYLMPFDFWGQAMTNQSLWDIYNIGSSPFYLELDLGLTNLVVGFIN